MNPHHLRGLVSLAAIAATFAACGGKLGDNGDAGGDAMLDGAAADAGWTACSSPSGYQLCGGAANCNPDCSYCIQEPAPAGVCAELDGGVPVGPDPLAPYSGCDACKDGAVCLVGTRPDGGLGYEQGILGGCVMWEVGELLFRGGDSNIIYADTSTFDGTPLPEPGDCPTIPGLTLCGGACGETCPDDASHICIGRSPKHPYSFCASVPTTISHYDCSRYNPPGDGKHGCLIFHDAPADQPQADLNGVYIDLPTCQAAAAGLPGGADCVTK